MNKFSAICDELLKHKKRIIVGVIGLSGSGKSHICKGFRKKGIGGGLRPHQIVVIDDLVMSINLLVARVKYKNKNASDYKPFFRLIPPWVKVVFITNPKKLEFADICLRISTDERTRVKNLKNREKNSEKLQNFINQKSVICDFKYDKFYEIKNENFNN